MPRPRPVRAADQRVVTAAVTSPAAENRPSCDRPGKLDSSIAVRAQGRRCRRQGHGRPDPTGGGMGGLGGPALPDQEQGVIGRHAQHGQAEAQGDGVHEALGQLDRHGAGQHARDERYGGRGQHVDGTMPPQQERRRPGSPERIGDHAHVGADRFCRCHREHAGTAHQQPSRSPARPGRKRCRRRRAPVRPASTSSALAGDVATSRARPAPAANQTPWRSSTRLSPRQTLSSSSQAPIGSVRPNCLTSGAAELLSCSRSF